MFRERGKEGEQQEEFWVERRRLPQLRASRFYEKLEETLEGIGFAEGVREICRPAYAEEAKGGRPGIDPAVYFKMLMIGFFENLPSERSIASRCADSFSLRAFLGYGLEEATPDHSSLSVIRTRLGAEVFQAALELVLRGLYEHGLLKGRHLGIDSSIIEANASLRELQNRNTEQDYWEYVKSLAAEAGIDPDDTKAVRRFDKKREGRKTSNKEWVNPHDADAKVGRTKDGACDMVYKPEHVSDLESGAIVRAEVRCGDAGDTVDLAGRVLDACETLGRCARIPSRAARARVLRPTRDTSTPSRCACFRVIASARSLAIRTNRNANPEKQCPATRATLRKAKQAVTSKSGKALLRKRGEHLERSFCHVLDHGGLRRATLRGRLNLTKRQIGAAIAFNFSLLMRHLHGIGTSKQWEAAVAALLARFSGLVGPLRTILGALLGLDRPGGFRSGLFRAPRQNATRATLTTEVTRFSTGC
jgi:transposase